jgi:hypothetical protein
MFIAYLGKGKLKLNIHLDYVLIHINSEKCINKSSVVFF